MSAIQKQKIAFKFHRPNSNNNSSFNVKTGDEKQSSSTIQANDTKFEISEEKIGDKPSISKGRILDKLIQNPKMIEGLINILSSRMADPKFSFDDEEKEYVTAIISKLSNLDKGQRNFLIDRLQFFVANRLLSSQEQTQKWSEIIKKSKYIYINFEINPGFSEDLKEIYLTNGRYCTLHKGEAVTHYCRKCRRFVCDLDSSSAEAKHGVDDEQPCSDHISKNNNDLITPQQRKKEIERDLEEKFKTTQQLFNKMVVSTEFLENFYLKIMENNSNSFKTLEKLKEIFENYEKLKKKKQEIDSSSSFSPNPESSSTIQQYYSYILENHQIVIDLIKNLNIQAPDEKEIKVACFFTGFPKKYQIDIKNSLENLNRFKSRIRVLKIINISKNSNNSAIPLNDNPQHSVMDDIFLNFEYNSPEELSTTLENLPLPGVDCFFVSSLTEFPDELGNFLDSKNKDGKGIIFTMNCTRDDSLQKISGKILNEIPFLPGNITDPNQPQILDKSFIFKRTDGNIGQEDPSKSDFHPILCNVDSFHGGFASKRAKISVKAAKNEHETVNEVARWDDGLPLVVTKQFKNSKRNYGNIVVLNFWPVSERTASMKVEKISKKEEKEEESLEDEENFASEITTMSNEENEEKEEEKNWWKIETDGDILLQNSIIFAARNHFKRIDFEERWFKLQNYKINQQMIIPKLGDYFKDTISSISSFSQDSETLLLEHKIQESEQRNKQTKEEQEKMISELEDSKQKLALANSELQQKEKEIEKKLRLQEKNQKEIEEQSENQLQKKKDLEQKRAEIERKMEEISKKEKEIEELSQDFAKKNEFCMKKEQDLKKKEEELHDGQKLLQEKNQKIEKDLSLEKSKSETFQKEIKKLNEALSEKIQTLTEAEDRFTNKLSSLQSEKKSLETKNQQNFEELDRTNSRIQQMQSEIERLNSKMKEKDEVIEELKQKQEEEEAISKEEIKKKIEIETETMKSVFQASLLSEIQSQMNLKSQECDTKLKDAAEELQKANIKIQELETRHKEEINQKNQIEEKNVKSLQEYKTLTQALHSKLAKTKEKLQENEQEIKNLNDELTKIKESKEQALEQTKNLENEKISILESQEKAKHQLLALQQTVSSNEHEIEALKMQNSELEKNLNEEITNKRGQSTELQKIQESAKAQLLELQEKIAEQNEFLSKKDSEIEALNKKIAEEIQNSKEKGNKSKELQNLLQEKESQTNDMNQKQEELRQKYDRLKQEYFSLQQRNAETENNRTQLHHQNQELKKKVDEIPELLKTIKQKQEDLTKLLQMKDELEKKLKQTQEELTTVKSRQNQQEKDISSFKMKIDKKNEEFLGLQQELFKQLENALEIFSIQNSSNDAVVSGEVIAEYLLGLLYLFGNPVIPKLIEKGTRMCKRKGAEAARFFEDSANKGNPISQYALATLLISGHGVPADTKKAVSCYEMASKQDFSPANFALGKLYYYGKKVEKSPEKAISYLSKAANRGHAEAQYTLGKIFFHQSGNSGKLAKLSSISFANENFSSSSTMQNQNLAKAFEFFEDSAAKGNEEALVSLGTFYYHGIYVQKDIPTAEEYFKKATLRDNPEIFYTVGKFYRNLDESTATSNSNILKAISYFEKAKNHPFALFEIGNAYYEGILNSTKDYTKAKQFLEISARLGNPRANYLLGDIFYYGGYGVDKSLQKAKENFEAAAKQQNHEDEAKALYKLGLMNYFGDSNERGEPNYKRALEFFESSKEKGFTDAIYYLGKMYYNGYGVKKNLESAKNYFEEASQKNHDYAMVNLGTMYLKGEFLEKNIDVAQKLFEEALKISNNANSRANFFLGEIFFQKCENMLKKQEPNESLISEFLKTEKFYLKVLEDDENDDEALNKMGMIYYKFYSIFLKNSAIFEKFLDNFRELKSDNEKFFMKIASSYFEKAAKLENCSAFYHLGVIYEKGHGCQLDLMKAKKFYKKAAKLGEVQANNALKNLAESNSNFAIDG